MKQKRRILRMALALIAALALTPFLICLTGCSTVPNQIVRQEYIKPQIPSLPAEPSYYPVQWGKKDDLYTLDFDNAKNLLKNVELMRFRSLELESILKGLQ
jgi:hypothetical protein